MAWRCCPKVNTGIEEGFGVPRAAYPSLLYPAAFDVRPRCRDRRRV
jgi:hypothetical protein